MRRTPPGRRPGARHPGGSGPDRDPAGRGPAAALATSVTGPIGFVSLISGPVAVRLVGAGRSVALAVPIGAAIVLGADVLAQHGPLISPVPTGVLTALLGAPYFVWLILRRRQGATA
ncbi:iron chelate uptake ABC transporter family permease subunit [Streptomyces avidinii]|uniref:iron chelate uptake ABC transporter family permease subunit n=1 Tax=Streptomyces avidinii TaxID=1895 RepID=UPI00386B689D|nr:iron chelate uptake ABC transporter family permease subunit [Streptomyces avidinii]